MIFMLKNSLMGEVNRQQTLSTSCYDSGYDVNEGAVMNGFGNC